MNAIAVEGLSGTRLRMAVVISEVFAPIVVIPFVVIVVSLHESKSLFAGLGYAAIAVAFTAALPYVALLVGLRRGQIADRQVRELRQRPGLLALTLVSVVSGAFVLIALDAPRDLVALVAAMVLGMGCCLVISTRWKLSLHLSCVAGVVTSVSLLLTPLAWMVLLPTCAALAWSRTVLGHHTVPQVVAGGALGVLAPVLVLGLFG